MHLKKRGIYIIIVLLTIIISIFFINAVVDKDNPWHSSNQVLITIDGYTMTLQEAIDNNVFINGATQSYTVGIPNPGHNEEDLLITIDGYTMTLQEAIDNNVFINGTTQSYTVSLPEGHSAIEIEVNIDTSSKSLQDALDNSEIQYTSSWSVSKPSTSFIFESNQQMKDNSLQKIDDTHYLNAYCGPDFDGFAVVLEVNPTTWSISKPSTNFEFDTYWAAGNFLEKIDNTHYLDVYSRGSSPGIFAVVLEVNPTTWSVSRPSSNFQFDSDDTIYSLQKIDDTHYLSTYYKSSTISGSAVVLEVNPTTWSVSKPSTTFEYDSYGLSSSVQKIDDTHYLNTYYKPSNQGVFAVVLEVNPTTWSVSNSSTAFKFDTGQRTHTNSLQKIDDTHYLSIYEGPAGNGLATVLEVNPTTWSVSEPSSTFEFVGDFYGFNSIQKIDNTHYIFVYSEPTLSGSAIVLEIDPNDWSVSKPSTTFEFDTHVLHKSLQQIDSSHYLNAYSGWSEDGYGFATVLEVDF